MKTTHETTPATQVALAKATFLSPVTVQNSAGQLSNPGSGPGHGPRRAGAGLPRLRWAALGGLLLAAGSGVAATLPVVTVQPQSRVVSAGAGVTLSVQATGDAPLTYEWWNEVGPLYPPQTGASLVLSAAQAGDAGRYSVRVRNAAGTVSSAEAQLTVVASNPDNFLHARASGGTGAEPGANLDTDAAGNVYAVGAFSGTAVFGGVTLTSVGDGDVFVVKYSAEGQVLWARQAGGAGADAGTGVSVDRQGNVRVTGGFSGTAQFGQFSLVSAGGVDAFVACYDRDGQVRWVQALGGTGTDRGCRIATDAAGNSYVVGEFSGTAAFRGGNLSAAGATDVFLAKWSAGGFPLWARRFGGTGSERVSGLALDSTGQVLLAGSFSGTIDFGGLSLTSGGGTEEVFLLKSDRVGGALWARKASGLHVAAGASVVADDMGNVFLTGCFSGTATFGTVAVTARGATDCVVAKYTSAGNVEWVTREGGSSKLGLSAGAAGTVEALGSGNLDWSGGTGQSVDVLVGRYPEPALATWARQAGSDRAAFSFGLLTDGAGNRFLTGFLENPDGAVNLDGDSLTLVSLARPVGPLPPSITFAPQSLTVNAGATATFSVTAAGANLGYQWRYRGTDIPGATGATFTRPNAQTGDAGTYSVVVHNADGAVTSPEVVLTVETVVNPPPTGPVVTITSPAEGAVITNLSIMVFGLASVPGGSISRVEVQNGSGSIVNASGTASWFSFASLRAGTNVFRARAVDTAGNVGAWSVRQFVQGQITTPPPTTSPITVTVTGNGQVSPNLNGQQLVVGSNYTVTATAGADSVFAGWSGSVSGSNPTLTFTMQPNFVLRANFSLVTSNPPPQTSPLALTVSGNGRVTPNLNGQLLTVGSVYTVTAIPDAGYEFTSWSGSIVGAGPTLTFVMQANMALRATFSATDTNTIAPPPPATNALVLTKATYNGLFYPVDAVQHSNSGPVTLSVSVGGSYTGTLRPGNKSISISGRFTPAGDATNRVSFNGATLEITLQLASRDGEDQVRGSVRGPGWNAPLWAARAASGSTSNPVPQAGRYTVVFPGAADAATSPGGHGYGTLTIDTAGKASLTATLGDGTAITRSVNVSPQGAWPLYASLYTDKGSVLGWIRFADRATDDLAGNVVWSCPSLSSRARYPAGFTNATSLVGSRYVKPATGVRILDFDYGVADFAGGNLPAPFQNQIYLATTNKVHNLSANKLSLSFSTSSGTFSGSATDPVSGKSVSFKGAVLQKRAEGAGHFLGTSQSGKMDFGR